MTKYLGIAIFVLVGLLGLLGNKLQGEIEEKTRVEVELRQTQESFGIVLDSVNKNIKDLELTQDKNRKVEIEFQKAKTKLEGMKNRENVVKAKPGLVANRINDSFDGLLGNISCKTGDRSSCNPP